uniref:B30.2/SPRY domain-containing protein n=1 Tax=Myripristis murdjan TaxID=586833 RepID=A0A667XPV0_9TELE
SAVPPNGFLQDCDLRVTDDVDVPLSPGPQEVQVAQPGQNVTLRCQGRPGATVRALWWRRADMEKTQSVLLNRDGHLESDEQHPSFVGRVELRDERLESGDLSVVLQNVTRDDQGKYECRFLTDDAEDAGKSIMDKQPSISVLRVEDPGELKRDTVAWCSSTGFYFILRRSVELQQAEFALYFRKLASPGSSVVSAKSVSPSFSGTKPHTLASPSIEAILLSKGVTSTFKSNLFFFFNIGNIMLPLTALPLICNATTVAVKSLLILGCVLCVFSPSDACDLTLDPNTVSRKLRLSEDNRKATKVFEWQLYPDHPDRFNQQPQVLCREGLTGRCYWEVQWSGEVSIAVTYRGITRSGDDSLLGDNKQSWSLECSDNIYYVRHNRKSTNISVRPRGSNRVAVYLDCSAGTLSFYRVSSDGLRLLHTFSSTFTELLHPAFGVWFSGSPSVVELPVYDASFCARLVSDTEYDLGPGNL